MHRITAIATGIAAVVGLAAGVTVAVTADDGGSAPTRNSAAPKPAPLLYVGNGRIFDGDKVVPFRRKGRVHDVRRTTHGYLVGAAISPQDATFDLWNVSRDGSSTRLAQVAPVWDVDPGGTRAVGYDVHAGQIRVWDLRTGKQVSAYATEGTDVELTAGFAGRDVLISQRIPQSPGRPDRIDLVRWNPDTGVTSSAGRDRRTGYRQMSLSPGGSYLAGLVGPDGKPRNDLDQCLHVESTFLKQQAVSWSSCAWTDDGRPVRFSPDGTRLLAVPAGGARVHLREVGVLDASDGPDRPVARIALPHGTEQVEWAGDDHLWASGSFDHGEGQAGTWIRRCDFHGTCGAAVRTLGPAKVASGY